MILFWPRIKLKRWQLRKEVLTAFYTVYGCMCKCVCELTTVFFSFFFVFYLCFRFARKATAQLPVGAAGIYFIFNVPLPTHFSSEIAVDEKQRPTAINLYVSLHMQTRLETPKNERSVYHFFLLYNSCPTALDSDLRKCELL